MRLSILLLLLAIPNLLCYELIQSISVSRHGARTPTSYNFHEGEYEEKEFGELTSLGKLQAYLMGREMRERYVNRDGYLPAEYDPNFVKIICSPKPRAIATAIFFTNGLYPQPDGITEYNMYNISKDRVLPLKELSLNLNQRDLNEMKVNYDWAVDKLEFPDPKKDFLFHGYKEENCPFSETIQEKIKSEADKDVEKFLKKALYPKIEFQLNSVLGWDGIDAKQLNRKKAKKIFDIIRCNSFHGLDYPHFDNETISLLKLTIQHMIYVETFSDDRVRTFAVSDMFTRIKKFVLSAVNEEEGTPKFIFFSGHDTNIEPILFCLITKDRIFSDEHYTFVPFISFINFGVYKNEGQYFIQTKFNDEVLQVENCKSKEMCTLDEFLAILDQYILPDIEESCKIQ